MANLNTRIVLRNDTKANFDANKDQVLLKGEVGVEFDPGAVGGKVKMKVGDGTTTWENLSYFGGAEAKTFTVGALDEIEDTDLSKGDTAIVKVLIDGTTDKYSYTGYVYNGTDWAAMDGNYNAENVYFDEDMMVTTQVGYITLSNGQGTIPSQGKNLKEVFEAMYVKESNPTTNQPAVSLTFNQANSYEVGTTVTPTYSASLSTGSYSYGPATGITASSWSVTDTAGHSSTSASGSFEAFTVADNTNYKITATATHGAGAIPVTNKGNSYAAGQIAAGNKSKTSNAVTGYRSFFYGASTKEWSELTTDDIRALTNGGAYNGAKSFTVKANQVDGAKCIVVAIPSNTTRGGLNTVILTSAMNTPVTDLYERKAATVKVEGVNKATAVDYDLYVYAPPSIDAGEVHAITLK